MHKLLMFSLLIVQVYERVAGQASLRWRADWPVRQVGLACAATVALPGWGLARLYCPALAPNGSIAAPLRL